MAGDPTEAQPSPLTRWAGAAWREARWYLVGALGAVVVTLGAGAIHFIADQETDQSDFLDRRECVLEVEVQYEVEAAQVTDAEGDLDRANSRLTRATVEAVDAGLRALVDEPGAQEELVLDLAVARAAAVEVAAAEAELRHRQQDLIDVAEVLNRLDVRNGPCEVAADLPPPG